MWPPRAQAEAGGQGKWLLPQASDSTSVRYLEGSSHLPASPTFLTLQHTCRLAKPHGGCSGGVGAGPAELVLPTASVVPGSLAFIPV